MSVCVFATSESFGRVLLLLPLDFSAEPPHTRGFTVNVNSKNASCLQTQHAVALPVLLHIRNGECMITCSGTAAGQHACMCRR